MTVTFQVTDNRDKNGSGTSRLESQHN